MCRIHMYNVTINCRSGTVWERGERETLHYGTNSQSDTELPPHGKEIVHRRDSRGPRRSCRLTATSALVHRSTARRCTRPRRRLVRSQLNSIRLTSTASQVVYNEQITDSNRQRSFLSDADVLQFAWNWAISSTLLSSSSLQELLQGHCTQSNIAHP